MEIAYLKLRINQLFPGDEKWEKIIFPLREVLPDGATVLSDSPTLSVTEVRETTEVIVVVKQLDAIKPLRAKLKELNLLDKARLYFMEEEYNLLGHYDDQSLSR